MTHLSKTATAALSAAALCVVVAACQPQGGPAATDEPPAAAAEPATATAPEATADTMSSDVLGAAEIAELLVGNTVIGVYDAWNLTWAEYFSPDGTTKLLLRFEGQDDMEARGKHYSNDEDQYCTEDPEQNAYCNKLVPLGDGRYQQVYPGGEKGAIYNQILEGEQLDAFR